MNKLAKRLTGLLDYIHRRGYATIDELVAHFAVTPQTIRRDINTLAAQKKVQRFHGGVGLPPSTKNILYEQRRDMFRQAKKDIAALVATHIPDSSSVCINIGTTTEEVAAALLHHKNLRVLTNNLHVATICTANPSFEILITSGTVRHHDHGVTGSSAERFISEFRVDYGVIGISGIDEEGNLLDFDYGEVSVARTIIASSRRVFLVTDNSKFGGPALARVGRLSDVTALFSNAPLEERWKKLVLDAGVKLYLAGE